MKPADMRTQSNDQLKESLVNLRKEAFNLRFQRASGQLENTARVRAVRRDIARVKTLLTQRKLGPAAPAPKGKAEAAPKTAKKAKKAKAKDK
jgi:large subunit ribosomal protein L29